MLWLRSVGPCQNGKTLAAHDPRSFIRVTTKTLETAASFEVDMPEGLRTIIVVHLGRSMFYYSLDARECRASRVFEEATMNSFYLRDCGGTA